MLQMVTRVRIVSLTIVFNYVVIHAMGLSCWEGNVFQGLYPKEGNIKKDCYLCGVKAVPGYETSTVSPADTHDPRNVVFNCEYGCHQKNEEPQNDYGYGGPGPGYKGPGQKYLGCSDINNMVPYGLRKGGREYVHREGPGIGYLTIQCYCNSKDECNRVECSDEGLLPFGARKNGPITPPPKGGASGWLLHHHNWFMWQALCLSSSLVLI